MAIGRAVHALVVDGDDTLWEDTIYFERAIERFVEGVAHAGHDPAHVRAVMDQVERQNVVRHGYGIPGFRHSLLDCFERLAGRPPDEAERRWLLALAQEIVDQPVALIDGVSETLGALGDRFPLILFTKGPAQEQARKVEGSGLAPLFSEIVITQEKSVDDYRRLIRLQALRPAESWMVGNSPRSDVIPALEAGLNAVFVPHSRTWTLEHAELPSASDRLIVLERFGDLVSRFLSDR